MTYESTFAVERLPLHLEVRFESLSTLFRGYDLTTHESFRSSIFQDLSENGPFYIAHNTPSNGILVLRVLGFDAASRYSNWAFVSGMLFGIPALLGVPTGIHEMHADLQASILDVKGREVISLMLHADCSIYSGVYFNHVVTPACLAVSLSSQLKQRIITHSSEISSSLLKHTSTFIDEHNPLVVAVLDFDSEAGVLNPTQRVKLADYLSAKIAEMGTASVVPRAQIRTQLEERKADSYKECYEASCQIEIGKALAATKVVSTRVIRAGFQCVILSTIFDLKRETSDSAASASTACEEHAIFSALDEVARRLYL